MPAFPIPPTEDQRLAALRSYAVLDTGPDEVLDALTRLASQACDVPICLISLVDAERQWFKSRVGFEASSTSRDIAFCAHAVADPGHILEVPDARSDPRFQDNPVVTGVPFVRFYAGAPLVTPSGHAIGTLCVLDTKPRALTPLQRSLLQTLARHAIEHLELAKQARALAVLLEEEQRASRQAREKSAMLEAILNTSVAAIVQVDTAGQIIYANPQGEAVLGLRRDAIVGRTYDSPAWRHTAPDGSDWPDQAQPFTRIMATGEPVANVEHAIEWPDGRRHQLSVNGAPIKDEHGTITSIVFSVTDITERVREAAARSAVEAQLQQAQRMEALGTLAGGIAHDFNNLLTIILGNVELARGALAGGRDIGSMLGDIGAAGQRARDLVRQILTFSRRHSMDRRPVELGPIVEELTRLLRSTLPAGILLTTRVDADTPRVLASSSQIHQALMNLCVNASHAMPNGQGRLSIGVTRVTLRHNEVAGLRDGIYACLTVLDTGTGMDAATTARIFDPFFTTKAPGEGTGLGLAVVDGIVKNHDGAITVSSQLGRGTAFRIYLPAAEAFDAPARPVEPVPTVSIAGTRVLLVEDEALLGRVAQLGLEARGCSVDLRTRPADAIAAYDRDPTRYDIVITDLNMPGMSGLEVARHVAIAGRGTPVVVTSGSITDDVRSRIRAAGAASLLPKPHTPEELAGAVSAALAQALRS